MRHLILAALFLALAACSQQQAAAVLAQPIPAVVTRADAGVQSGIAAYPIALGIAQVAAVARPALAPAVAAIQARATPLIAQVQAGSNALAADATLRELAAQLLTLGTAYIEAVPNGRS